MDISNFPQLKEKLERLRMEYPGDYKLIANMEINFQKKLRATRIADAPEIKELIEDARERIGGISTLLAFDPTLNDGSEISRQKRIALFHERQAHLFWLNRFDFKIEDEVTRLMAFIDEKLE